MKKRLPHSEERKRKISESMKGKNKGKNNGMFRKVSPRKGKKHTDESKLKMSESSKGQKPNSQCFKKDHIPWNKNFSKYNNESMKIISEKMTGLNNFMYDNHTFKGKDGLKLDKHWNWKGGISFNKYCHKFNEKLKTQIRNRDNNICQLCGKTKIKNNKNLDVHHIHYDKENCNPDLISLCHSCHTITGINRDYWEVYLLRKLVFRGLAKIYNLEEIGIENYGVDF